MLLVSTALELGLISALTVLALYLSYTMLDICDLSTDGCFTLGAAVGAIVAISGHPYLSIIAAMGAGVLSGFITAFLQTKLGVNSLLAGIIVNTGLYSINIAVMNNTSLLNMNNTDTIFTKFKSLLENTFLAGSYKLVVAVIFVALVLILLTLFLKTRMGLAIRATGNNLKMSRAQGINVNLNKVIGLMLSNGLVALAGALLTQYQGFADINMGRGAIVIGLAAVVIGEAIFSKIVKNFALRLASVGFGAVLYFIVYQLVISLGMDTDLMKMLSAIVVAIFLGIPYLKKKYFDSGVKTKKEPKNPTGGEENA